MVKCITLEYPDGSLAIRGGFGPTSLASFLLLVRGGARRSVSLKEAQTLLSEATPSEIEEAHDAGLQYVLDEKVPTQNPTVIARIEDVTFPSNRTFRTAWKRGTGKIDVDMPKARAFKTDQIRSERDGRLVVLDVEYLRADETADTAEKQRIATLKQVLRDLPATIQPALNAIATPSALEAYAPPWPT